MCGRLIAGDLTQAEMLAILERYIYPDRPVWYDHDAPPPAQGFNVKPTNQVPILLLEDNGQLLSSASWWLVPHWQTDTAKARKYPTFNARLETAAEKPTFRDAWKHGRCLVLAQGYYEWSGPKGDKQPHRIWLEQNNPLMLFAALQSVARDGIRSCTIITREALPEIADIKNRMPVLLTPFEAERWLDHSVDDDHIRDNFGLGVEGRFLTHRIEVVPENWTVG